MSEGSTLLIVDDEPETLKGYQAFLAPAESAGKRSARKSSRHGTQETVAPAAIPGDAYRVLLAQSGEEAIELFKTEQAEGRRVAAGFFDIKLGSGMDGLQTIQAIKKLDPDIHCVVVTAYHDRTVDEINHILGDDFKDRWDF